MEGREGAVGGDAGHIDGAVGGDAGQMERSVGRDRQKMERGNIRGWRADEGLIKGYGGRWGGEGGVEVRWRAQ